MNLDSIRKRVEAYQDDGKVGMVVPLEVLTEMLHLIDNPSPRTSIKLDWHVDGDQVCVTKSDFINLQESPAVFFPSDGPIAKMIIEKGILALPAVELLSITSALMPHLGVQIDGQGLPPCKSDNIDLREKLAYQVHTSWMRYIFHNGQLLNTGQFAIDADKVKRWTRQMETPYDQLPFKEQASDRANANRYLELMG